VKRYDLLAISLLMFAAILVTAMATDPKGFSLRDWQPLMAAFVALGAASLAYHAAMARLGHDRHLAAEEKRRKALGICLRLRFGVGVQKRELEFLMDNMCPLDPVREKDVAADALRVRRQPAIEEAWQNLDLFPAEFALTLNNIHIGMRNYELFKERHADKNWTLKPGEPLPTELKLAREVFSHWKESCAECLERLLKLVRTELRK
jgi:hypothetical protein